MSGVECRSRLEQLQALERRVRHEQLDQRIAEEIKAEGGKPLPKRPGKPKTRRQKADDRVTKRLQQLGVTSHEVKVWAVSVGLLDGVRRGRIKGEVVEAYAAAHTDTDLGGAA